MDRGAFLFGKILGNRTELPIQYFNVDDIYNFINLDVFIIIDAKHTENKHLNALIQELKETDTNIKCKILLLGSNRNLQIHNIYEISEYLLVDETNHFIESSSPDFILIHLQKSTEEHLRKIEGILYPKNKEIPVKIINNEEFSHCQNLGLCTEELILELIQECKYYININDMYLYDAINANKNIVDINKLPNRSLSVSNLDQNTINKKEYINNTEHLRISNIIDKII